MIARAAVLAAAAASVPRASHAAPLELAVSASGGFLTAPSFGAARDDAQLSIRLGIAVGRYVAAQVGFDADLERLELGARVGAIARPYTRGRFHPYARLELAIVGADYLGRNWEITAGAGWRVRATRWLTFFVEVDAVGRVSPPRSLAEHVVAGVALTAPSFWPLTR